MAKSCLQQREHGLPQHSTGATSNVQAGGGCRSPYMYNGKDNWSVEDPLRNR